MAAPEPVQVSVLRRLFPLRVRRYIRLAITIALMLGLAGLYLVPFYWMILKSFQNTIFLIYPPDFNPLHGTSFAYFTANVGTVLSTGGTGYFARSFLNTIFIAGSVTALSVFFGSLAGYAFARLKFPGRDLLFYVVLATLMIPFPLIFVSSYFFMYDLGWLNTYQGLIFPQVASGFNVFLMRQYFTTIPTDIENAAKLDGLRPWQIFFRISAPLAKPAFAAVTIFTFLGSWNNFLWPLVVSSSPSFWTVPVALILFKGVNGTQVYWNEMMTATLLMMIPTLVVYAFAERYFIQGIAFSAAKG